jgi:hypothetical protein
VAPRIPLGALDDLRRITEAIDTLPRVLDRMELMCARMEALDSLPKIEHRLRDIDARVENLDGEVTGMHHAVERINDDVVMLRGAIDETLRESLDEMSRTLHPLRRTAERAGRIMGRKARISDDEALAEELAEAAERDGQPEAQEELDEHVEGARASGA